MKRKTTEEFIRESNIIHDNRYDYSLVDYKNNKKNVIIICKQHGQFEQYPQDHLKKHGCPVCAGNQKLTTLDFIKISKEIYEKENYDYSLVKYINNKKPVNIICQKHGNFNVRPDKFMQKYAKCPKCYDIVRDTDNFIKKSIEIHENLYDYTLVDYTGNEKKVKIICPKHGIFEQTPHSHMNGSKCPKCSKNRKLTKELFIEISKLKHKDKYDYSLVHYNRYEEKVKIICKKHGIFEQKPSVHLNGSGCQKCNKSKGEIKIENFLKINNINYIEEHKFEKCKNINQLPFDFYLPEYNTCIEFDGEYHFFPKRGINNLNKTKENDKIKNMYCQKNNINLIRINYKEINNIYNILKEKIN